MLSVLGFKSLWDRNRLLFVVLTFISISLILAYLWINPNGEMGGFDPPFRYISPIIPLLSIPFAVSLDRFSKNWIYRILLIVFVTIGFSFSFAFSSLTRLSSIEHFEIKANTIHTVYRGLEQYFPSLPEMINNPVHHPMDINNWVFVTVLTVLLCLGILITFYRKSKPKIIN